MDTYEKFSDRIDGFETRDGNFGGERFSLNAALAHKVGFDNRFKNFYGDTVVFDLSERAKSNIEEIVDILYGEAGECFCERLKPHTFHVTLHDFDAAASLSDIAEALSCNERKVLSVRDKVKALGRRRIAMRSKCVFNMVGTSVVLGVCPVDADGYDELMRLYHIFDGVKKLDYALTPHVTLAYYNINGLSAASVKKLTRVVTGINARPALELELDTDRLVYQKFTSMNDFTDILDFA